MKIQIINIIFILFLLTGCASSRVRENPEKIAVFALYSNKSINWFNDGFNKNENQKTGGILSDQVNKLVDNNNPEHFSSQNLLINAEKIISQKFEELTDIHYLEPERVINSFYYSNLHNNAFSLIESKEFFPGYSHIYTTGKKNNRLILTEIDADSMLSIEFIFEKKLLQGNKWTGELTAFATMKVSVISSDGKISNPKLYQMQSTHRIPINKRKYDRDFLISLYPELIENLITKFIMNNYL